MQLLINSPGCPSLPAPPAGPGGPMGPPGPAAPLIPAGPIIPCGPDWPCMYAHKNIRKNLIHFLTGGPIAPASPRLPFSPYITISIKVQVIKIYYYFMKLIKVKKPFKNIEIQCTTKNWC